MNRQIVAFLSLFSLVLVLSIYYVVDSSSTLNSSDTLVNGEVENEDIEVNSSSYYFSSLALARDEKHQEIIDEQVSLIASNDADSEVVILAKETISKQEDIIVLEEVLEGLIMECECVSSYVEILDNEYLLKAYKPDLKQEEEILLVDTIFSKIDKYIEDNSILLIENLHPVIELKY